MTAAADPSRARGAEPFLRGVAGALVLLLAMRWLEPVLFEPGYYASLAVHPFWVIVVLASVQGGLFVGVATAGLAAALMDWPARPLDVDVTLHYATLAVVPIEWMLSALLFGTFRQLQIATEVAVRRENADLRETNALIADEVAALDRALDAVELDAATQAAGDGAALRALAALGAATPGDADARLREAARLLTDRPGAAHLPWAPADRRRVAWGEGAAPLAAAFAECGHRGPHPVVELDGAAGGPRFAASAAIPGPIPASVDAGRGWIAIAAGDEAEAEALVSVAQVLALAAAATMPARTVRELPAPARTERAGPRLLRAVE